MKKAIYYTLAASLGWGACSYGLGFLIPSYWLAPFVMMVGMLIGCGAFLLGLARSEW